MTITCEQFLTALADYLDADSLAAMDPAMAEAVREHSKICAPCLVVLDTTQQTVRMVGDVRNFEMPEGASERLRRALDEGLGEPLVPATLRAGAAPASPRGQRSGRIFGFGFANRLRATAFAFAVTVVILVAGVDHWRARATTTSGWLIDQHCFKTYASHLADHPRDCLLACADRVYGLVDAKGHFTRLDAKGSKQALAAVQASSKPDHIWVTIHAKRSSDNQVLEVQDLALTDPTDAAGSSR